MTFLCGGRRFPAKRKINFVLLSPLLIFVDGGLHIIMKRFIYIFVFLLSAALVAGCSGHSGVNSIYSMGVYDAEALTEQDAEALERYLRSVGCMSGESFVVEGENIYENNRKAAERFASAVSKIDYAELRKMLSDDISFTYAVVCGSATDGAVYLESVEFSPRNKD